jgi:hypothetical protein
MTEHVRLDVGHSRARVMMSDLSPACVLPSSRKPCPQRPARPSMARRLAVVLRRPPMIFC